MRYILLSVLFILVPTTARCDDQTGVIVKFDSSNLRFHAGGVTNNAPRLLDNPSPFAGDRSRWVVVQWNKKEILNPRLVRYNDSNYRDDELGVPQYTFTTSSRESRVSVFEGSRKDLTFELYSSGGGLSKEGGANLFLANYDIPSGVNFGRDIEYALTLRLSQADIVSTLAARNAAVMAQILTGFTVYYMPPGGGQKTSAFIQLSHSDSSLRSQEYRGCYPVRDHQNVVFNPRLPSEERLSFTNDLRAKRRFIFSINKYVCELARLSFSCENGSGPPSQLAFPHEAQDPANWYLTSIYFGLETQARDERSQPASRDEGQVDVGVQVSDLSLSQRGSKPVLCDNAPRTK